MTAVLRHGVGAPPEIAAGGYGRADSTVEFYTRVRALAPTSPRVLDVGAGRGAWVEDGVTARRKLRDLRDIATDITGVDVDQAIQWNSTLDRAVVVPPHNPWPLPSDGFDLAIADFVLEHLDEPMDSFREIHRVLVPGGWFCARTTNRLGYIGLSSRLVPERLHAATLKRAQPSRQECDVFPGRYRCNTPRIVREQLHLVGFRPVAAYGYAPDFSYGAGRPGVSRGVHVLDSVLPDTLKSTLLVFAQKRAAS